MFLDKSDLLVDRILLAMEMLAEQLGSVIQLCFILQFLLLLTMKDKVKGRRQKSGSFGWYLTQMRRGRGGLKPDHIFWSANFCF